MTRKQRTIFTLVQSGKSVEYISHALGMNKQSVYNIVHRMKKNGIDMKTPKEVLPITEKQKAVLYFYMVKTPIPEIAKKLGITCQTVMNHANMGFIRLRICGPGDRITKLRELLDPLPEITMDDPFFN